MVIPFNSVRWKITKKMIDGKDPSRAAAAWVVGSVVYCPEVAPRESVTVWFEFDGSRMRGSRNSFHVQMKKKTHASAGFDTPLCGYSTGTTRL